MKIAFYKSIILLIVGFFINSCIQEDVTPNLLVGWKEETNGKVQFTNLTENADSFLWEFDDKTTSTEKTPIKTYSQNGPYTVKVTATNNKKQSTKVLVITVKGVVLERFEITTQNYFLETDVFTYLPNPQSVKESDEEFYVYGLKFDNLDNPPTPEFKPFYNGADPIIQFSGFDASNIKSITTVKFPNSNVNWKFILNFEKPFEISFARADKGNYNLTVNRNGEKVLYKSIVFKALSLIIESAGGTTEKSVKFFLKMIENTPKTVEDEKKFKSQPYYTFTSNGEKERRIKDIKVMRFDY